MRGVFRIGLLVVSLVAACQLPPSELYPQIEAGMFPWEDAAPPKGDCGVIVDSGGQPHDAGGNHDLGPGPAPAFTVIALPDTQYYSSNFPYIFDAQIEWIVAEHRLGNVAFVLTVGDIVDADTP